MSTLLVNSPTGTQELVEVGAGGGYFDTTRVLWDERVDGTLPAITLGGMVRVGGELVFDQVRMDEHIAASKPAVPQQVTMRQARLALLAAGKLDTVSAAIASLPSPDKEEAQIEWEYSQTVERGRRFVAMLAPALGLDSAALDQLFITAATL